MTRRPHLALCAAALLSLSACEKKEPPPPPAPPSASASSGALTPSSSGAVRVDGLTGSSGAIVQAKLGGGSERGGTLAFEITSVHEKVDRADAPPWWKGSGAWTFFDATTSDGATMTIGYKETRRLKSDALTYILGEVVIATKNTAEGEKVVKSFAKALAVPAPDAPATRKALVPLVGSSVVLAENATRDESGSFTAGGGTWTASKWTFEGAGGAEIFCNYDLTAKKGEFARKSSSYDPKVVQYLAASLRDGAPLGEAAKDGGK